MDFGFEHYERMADLARRCKGRMIVSINDHPEIRAVFAGLAMETVPIKYTVGGAHQGAELIIRNW